MFRFPGAGRLLPARAGARERRMTEVDPALGFLMTLEKAARGREQGAGE
ncbi:MAG: hypothetical protein AB1560_12095 [Pseudomonadota bacterium]